MPTFLTVEARPTFRDWQGRFAKAKKTLLESRQPAMTNLGRTYVEAAKRYAPKGKTGKFAQSIGFQTFTSPSGVGFRAYAQQPLFTWITEGTRPHIIPGNPLLAFEWEKGPDGAGMYFFHWVNHPGTQPNPFHEKAMQETKGEINPEMAKISTRMFNSLKG